MLSFLGGSREGQRPDFVSPFRMQMEFDFVIPGSDQVDDGGKVFDAEPSCKQGLDKKDPLQAVAV